MSRSTSLSRRTFLRAGGVAVGLPLLEAMVPGTRQANAAEGNAGPRRMACIYVPNGVNNAKWIPKTPGLNYELSPTHEPLKEFKDDFSILSGMGHPGTEAGHAGGDTFLTGAVLKATPGYDYKNSISVDQLAAEHFSQYTRFASLELSRKGGTGSTRATHTLSFSRSGVPLAAENSPRLVFERLFLEGTAAAQSSTKQRFADDKSILDMIQDDTKSLNHRLGQTDKQKLDEYLTAVRSVEKQVRRAEDWMAIPKPKVDAAKINLDVNPESSEQLRDYLRTMFDLMFLSFQTDTTRVCTFQMHPEVANLTFKSYLGFVDHYHGLSHHGGDPEALEKLAKIDRFHIEQFAYFLAKLKSTREADGSLLDRTLIVYGSGMSNGETGGHYATNIPILFAGGRGLGIKQGQHLAYKQPKHAIYGNRPDAPPLCNLFSTMLTHLAVPASAFGNSTGKISELSA